MLLPWLSLLILCASQAPAVVNTPSHILDLNYSTCFLALRSLLLMRYSKRRNFLLYSTYMGIGRWGAVPLSCAFYKPSCAPLRLMSFYSSAQKISEGQLWARHCSWNLRWINWLKTSALIVHILVSISFVKRTWTECKLAEEKSIWLMLLKSSRYFGFRNGWN